MLHEYIIAAEAKPDNVSIRLGKAIVGITTSGTDSTFINFYKDLEFVIQKHQKNLLALYYLAI